MVTISFVTWMLGVRFHSRFSFLYHMLSNWPNVFSKRRNILNSLYGNQILTSIFSRLQIVEYIHRIILSTILDLSFCITLCINLYVTKIKQK